MLEVERLDSLEGWVAVKENAFKDESTPPRLTFLVSWNDVHHKVAVTCRARSRVARDTEDCSSRSAAYTFQELKGIHQVLMLVHPGLADYFPHLPDEPRGVWAIFYSPRTPCNISAICQALENYFSLALEVCKETLLMATLFEELDTTEYFESIGELRKQGLMEEIRNAEEELRNVGFERDQCTTMQDVSEAYVREDVALQKLLQALAQFYNWELQPFLDLREGLACGAGCWLPEDLLSRMEEDRQRFGKNAFELVASDRVLRLKTEMHTETVQLLQNRRKQFIQERDKVKEEIGFLSDEGNVRRELERLEKSVYTWQCRILQTEMDILHEKELLVQSQIQARKRQINDLQEEESMVFHDAVQDVDELSDGDDSSDLRVPRVSDDPEIAQLQGKLASLHRQRARIRTRKNNLEQKHLSKEQRKEEEAERIRMHHTIQIKRDEQKAEEMKKKDFIDEERRKTIERLRTFKVKYPAPAAIKAPRYQRPSERRMSGSMMSSTNSLAMESIHNKRTYTASPTTEGVRQFSYP
nr:hypothetical protein BaRGS_030215 [Batillaria attramentaria]